MKSIWRACIVSASLWGCQEAPPSRARMLVDHKQSNLPAGLQPIPLHTDLDDEVVRLGELLFHDKRLSADDTVSCASCHDLDRGGVDGTRVSVGINGAIGTINAPTVFNAAYSFTQFWDGRAATLEEQVDGPTHGANEMGSSWAQIIGKLGKDAALTQRFRKAFADGWTPNNIRTAIATFERSLITPNSSFDRFLRGEAGALSPEALQGWKSFQNLGCIACHQGVALGGNMFQRFGVLGDYFEGRGKLTKADLGRFNVTKLEHDRHVFKVPSLRNVARTAPYFHDGSAPTLEQAVSVMARYQLGRELNEHDREAIVAFLESLTGEYRGKPL